MSQVWWSKLFSPKKANSPYEIVGKYKDVRVGDRMILNQLAKKYQLRMPMTAMRRPVVPRSLR